MGMEAYENWPQHMRDAIPYITLQNIMVVLLLPLEKCDTSLTTLVINPKIVAVDVRCMQ